MINLFIALQAILPQHLLSRMIGWLAELERPVWLKNLLITLFMQAYGISLDEAEHPNAEQYRNFNHFFTRALEEGARPLAGTRYVSPADCILSQRGDVDDGQLVQAKGRWYDTRGLLAGSEEEAANFDNGSFATVYLSPKDYHRVHMPISGTLRMTRYVPGDLFAVNNSTTAGVDQLFARNERLVCFFDTADGQLAVVLVGAIIVAGIETVWGGVESPNPGTIREHRFSPEEAPTLEAGAELGRFFLGSTVVLLTEKNGLQWRAGHDDKVLVRAALAD